MFPLLVKPASDNCDLSCRGCFYKGRPGMPKGLPKEMPFRTALAMVEVYAKVVKADEACYFWQGGEPTLWPIRNYRGILEVQKVLHGGVPQNIIQTHGLNLTEEWLEMFAQWGWGIGLSFDGPHGMGRHWDPDVEDKLAHVAAMLRELELGYTVVCTVDTSTALNPKGTVRSLYRIGSTVQFIPRRAREVGENSPLVPNGAAYAHFLEAAREEMAFFDMRLVNDISADDAWSSVASCCEVSETCGETVVVESDGSLYPCDFHVFPGYCAGNINEIDDLAEWYKTNPVLLEFRKLKHRKHADCEECQARPACHRGCPRDRYLEAGSYNDKTRWCEALKQCAEETRPAHPPHNYDTLHLIQRR